MELETAKIRAWNNQRKLNNWQFLFPKEGKLSRHNYPKHIEFIDAGRLYRERLMMAANRVGKSELGAYEVSRHLTGEYPDWWEGRKFGKATNILVAGETAKLTRDSVQIKLCGEFGQLGTGLIPKDAIVDVKSKAGVPDAIDLVKVKHKSGGISTLQFQSYDQGREAFQATARDVVWFDEEPPMKVYTEGVTRTMTTKGMVITTFTPLKGVSETVLYLRGRAEKGEISYITATWDDAPHLSQHDKDEMLKVFPEHERYARSSGIPSLGSGAIYDVPLEEFVIEPFSIPKTYRKVFALDFGWNNTAVVWGAYDDDTNTWYIYDEYKQGKKEPGSHANAIKARGDWIPGVCDPAGATTQADGKRVIDLYVDLGLKLSYADNSVDAGIFEVWQRLSDAQLKVFRTCEALLAEYRMYRRDEKGKIVKENDHLMDALRYLIMSGGQLATFDIKNKKQKVSFRLDGSSECL